MGNAAEPDTRHFIHKDIYTFIKFVDAASLVDTVDEERKKVNYLISHKIIL